MNFQFSIPSVPQSKQFNFSSGETIVFVGANGSGKTRLSVQIEQSLGLQAHRISAHRALSLNPQVQKISEEKALRGLRIGNTDPQFDGNAQLRSNFRYGNGKEATSLVNDFDFVLQALFAEQTNHILATREAIKSGAREATAILEPTKFDRLKDTWEQLLPHRRLSISGDDIVVSPTTNETTYTASDMSDGERAIFYMLGQALVVANESVLIVDEPELHVHRSLMSKLWDAVEALRPDCGFVFITHDLEFAASRAAQKFVVKDYQFPPSWVVEEVPTDTGFSEEITTLILGSRKPVLFVEGTAGSLDIAIYRSRYRDWTVVPRSSCTEVIHSVVTMRRNAELTRVTCAGIVDGDDYEDEDRSRLEELSIMVLPVSEVENLVLLPDVMRTIASMESFVGVELEKRLEALSNSIFQSLDSQQKIESAVVRYCQRRVDRMLKKLDLSSAKTISELKAEYADRTNSLSIEELASRRISEIESALKERDLPRLLKYYDNKEMLALAASQIKSCRRDVFEGWIIRTLSNNTCPDLVKALSRYLPEIHAQ